MMRFPTGFLLERPSDIHSKLTGRQISKWLCVSLGISPACIPMVMLLIGELDKYWICGCIIFGALFTFNMMASNQLLFAFRKNKYVVLNVCGFKKREISLDCIKAIAIVGSAWAGAAIGSNHRLGYKDRDGLFHYYPYLLLYTDRNIVEYQGEDMRAYEGYAGDFILIKDNLEVYKSIVDGTRCNLYVDKRLAGSLDVPEGRRKELNISGNLFYHR